MDQIILENEGFLGSANFFHSRAICKKNILYWKQIHYHFKRL